MKRKSETDITERKTEKAIKEEKEGNMREKKKKRQ